MCYSIYDETKLNKGVCMKKLVVCVVVCVCVYKVICVGIAGVIENDNNVMCTSIVMTEEM